MLYSFQQAHQSMQQTLIESQKGKSLLPWNVCMRSVKENTYSCSGLIDGGETCMTWLWFVCFIWTNLRNRGEGPPVTLSRLWNPVNTHKYTPYALYLLPLHCHHNQSDWLLRCCIPPTPPLFVFFPVLPLPFSQHISRTWWNPPTFEVASSRPPSSFQSLYPFAIQANSSTRTHPNSFRYPTLSTACSWDIFHPSTELIFDLVAVIRECNSKIFVAKLTLHQ